MTTEREGMLEKKEKLTPQKIAEKEIAENCFYSIPIYQRLFEWDSENIDTLLSDLWHCFEVSKGEDDYYIGMLTSTKEHELVDGQQRFVVMMLMGCVLKEWYPGCPECPGWNNFIKIKEKPRLEFTSRPKDDEYLKAIIEDEPAKHDNTKMKNGEERIRLFLEKVDKKHEFAQYIYEHLSFFISELPVGYSPIELNMYFERMNTTGRNLEQHEILKVKLLRHLDDSNTYMQLWNKLADVDTLLRKEKTEEALDEGSQSRKVGTIRAEGEAILEAIKKGNKEKVENGDSPSIEETEAKSLKLSPFNYEVRDSRCPLEFSELLLQVLYLHKKVLINESKEKKEITLEDFFKTSNLLDTFSKFLCYEGDNVDKGDIEAFMKELMECRLKLDICFIRPTEGGYSLNMNLPEDNDSEDKKSLMMYESMLYVSSSNNTNYKWFGWLMDGVKSSENIPTAKKLCEHLKRKDNEENPFIEENLSYPSINRYWFWRLDYYLWENREIFFNSKETRKVADDYVFRRNRSIEHIVPQTPQGGSKLQWEDRYDKGDANFDEDKVNQVKNKLSKEYQQWEKFWNELDDEGKKIADKIIRDNKVSDGDDIRVSRIKEKLEQRYQQWEEVWKELDKDKEGKKIADKIIRNSIGNLAMISSRMNSSLGNEPYEVKEARVKSHCEGSVGSSIESLNLLWIYEKYETWNYETFRRNILQHGERMMALLKDSFTQETNTDVGTE